MGAMYRLKAYFGMVPADEFGEYVDDPELDYPPARGAQRWEDRGGAGPGDDEVVDEVPAQRWERRTAEPVRAAPSMRPVDTRPAPRAAGLSSAATVHGSLAVERELPPAAPEPERARPEPRPPVPARITTLQPRSYNEARTIGERYRDGIPVIMNLTELDDAAAKRLVDFAAGLAFALRGSIDKVTSRVFLLTPPEVEVSADDARRVAERTRLFGDG